MIFNWHTDLWESRFRAKALHQSLLLTATRGTGEIEFALRVAKSRLCQTPADTGDACGTCTDCRWFDSGTHPDFRRLDPAIEAPDQDGDDDRKEGERDKKRPRTQISVDEVRGVIEFLHVVSHRGGARVVVIHPAHALNAPAANALLKILEEPPAGVLFLLVTAQPARLPATIRSRCVTLALPKPSPREAASWLEDKGLVNPVLTLAQVGGAPTAALGLDERYWAVRETLLPHISVGEPDWPALASRIGESDLPHLVHILQTWCWDLTSARFGGDVRYHPDHAKAITRAATRVGSLAVTEFVRKLAGARRLLGHPMNPKLFAEDLLMSYSRLTPVQ